ncbi:MAG: DUF433 domain-containing protein [Acidobacteria bacterium]|nr:DUF433 domain-containing protein [Acidobacteriota bacterium]
MSRRVSNPDPYGGLDPRAIATYTVAEAAHYLWLPEQTLRTWVYPRPPSRIKPVVPAADAKNGLLSFVNLLELHVLAAIRRQHGLKMSDVRRAVGYLARQFGHEHPLVDADMVTDGQDLFMSHLGKLVNITREGQLAMRDVLVAHLKRIERDEQGLAVRLYPFTRPREASADAPRLVSIDPRVAFGRPVLAGSRIPTAEVAERFTAGEPLTTLAREYGRPAAEIEEAIRCEFRPAA